MINYQMQKNELRSAYNISDLFLSDYDYNKFFVPPLRSPIPPLEGD